MVFSSPQQPTDFFDVAGAFLDGAQGATGFVASNVPGASGLGTRQSYIQNNRPAVSTRQLIHWLIPEGPIVQMYINPQNISYNYKKTISPQRTKGGFVIQYWGPELTTLNISGTTGTSGIEGINVLYDIYNSEQVAFDPFALYLNAQQEQQIMNAGLASEDSALIDGANFVGSLIGGSQSLLPTALSQPPNLASLACGIEMYYSGEVYRGFFTDFSVKESSDSLGMFNYDMNFVVTQKRGFRQNFLAWHRSATSGPSNSHPQFGVPYSYGPLVGREQATPQRNNTSNANNLRNATGALANSLNLGSF